MSYDKLSSSPNSYTSDKTDLESAPRSLDGDYPESFGSTESASSSYSLGEEAKLLKDATSSVTLSWNNVTVTPPPPKKPWFKRKKYNPLKEDQRPILSRNSGIVHPGNLLAVIGASGSGKSVLLNVLTNRNLGDLEVTGEVKVNGQSIGKQISKISAYVQQTDAFIGTLKVREHLWFQTQLRLGNSLSEEQKNARVSQVLKELGLSHRAETMIGIPGRMKTLSGGERRRLMFASEILTNPLVLFCDEPTTGLDAFMAQSVIGLLRTMAARGLTIICTIHQPASEVYAMFDKLALLAEGRMAFLGSTRDVLPFFSSIGYPCPANYNPADFFIHTLAPVPGKLQEQRENISRVCDAYENSVYLEDIKNDIKASQEHPTIYRSSDDLYRAKNNKSGLGLLDENGTGAGWFKQLHLLCWRSWIQQWRDPVAMKSSFVQFTVIGIFMGLTYLQQDYDQAGVQNIDGAMYMIQLMVLFNTMFSVLSVLPGEWNVFKRDYQDNMYRVDTYYLSHILTEFPTYGILAPLLFVTITYWMIGLYPGVTQFFQAVAAMCLASLYALGIAHIVACLTCSIALSLSILPLIRNILNVFGGFFVNPDSVPKLLVPLQAISAFIYTNEIVTVNQWQNVDHIACTSNGENTTTSRCLSTGEAVIESLSFDAGNVGRDYGILVALYIAFEILGFLALRHKALRLK